MVPRLFHRSLRKWLSLIFSSPSYNRKSVAQNGLLCRHDFKKIHHTHFPHLLLAQNTARTSHANVGGRLWIRLCRSRAETGTVCVSHIGHKRWSKPFCKLMLYCFTGLLVCWFVGSMSEQYYFRKSHCGWTIVPVSSGVSCRKDK